MTPIECSGRISRVTFCIVCTTLLCASMAMLLAGCSGGAQKAQAQRLGNLSILSATAPLEDRLIKRSEVDSASDTNGVRTFLEFWSLLQYRAWDQALATFVPGLRETIGPALLTGALAGDVLVWQATKPQIVSTAVTNGTALIRFVARDELDHLLPSSISLQKVEGVWRVVYFSLLDAALQRSVQLREQAAIDPLATKPAAEAVRQGDAAGSLQSAYLERQIRSKHVGNGAVP
jgi:hypothetical protein